MSVVARAQQVGEETGRGLMFERHSPQARATTLKDDDWIEVEEAERTDVYRYPRQDRGYYRLHRSVCKPSEKKVLLNDITGMCRYGRMELAASEVI